LTRSINGGSNILQSLQHICKKLLKAEADEDATGVHGKRSFKMRLTKWLITMSAVHKGLKVIFIVNLIYLNSKVTGWTTTD
jgi:hypothetical protein